MDTSSGSKPAPRQREHTGEPCLHSPRLVPLQQQEPEATADHEQLAGRPAITLQDRKEEGTLIRLESL